MLFDGCKGKKWTDRTDGTDVTVKSSKLVFIGMNLQEYSLKKDFLSCREKSIQKMKNK